MDKATVCKSCINNNMAQLIPFRLTFDMGGPIDSACCL